MIVGRVVPLEKGLDEETMKRRPRWITICIILLFLVGFGIMFYPTASDWYTRWQLQKELALYNEVAQGEQVDYSEMWAAAEDYNRRLAERENQFAVSEEETEEISNLLNPMGIGMMGYIDIDRISVHLPIYQGTEESALQAGAGWWIGTSLPTGGESTHCVLTAHTGLVKAKMFTDLDQLEVGDTFSLTVLDRILTYQVDQVLITEPDEIDPLLIEKGKDYCTLYTCYPYGVNTHRLLVRGSRIPTPEQPETAIPVLAEAGRKPWMLAAAAGVVVIIAAGAAVYAGRRTKRKVQTGSMENEKDKKEGNG